MAWIRPLAKEIIYNAANMAGLTWIARHRIENKLIILTYHSFAEKATRGPVNRMPIRRFEKQVAFLKRHFWTVSLSEGLRVLSGQAISKVLGGRPMVAITVDDGFVDNYTLMFKVIQKYKISASVFLATDFLDSGRAPWPTQILELLGQTKARSLEYPVNMQLDGNISKIKASRVIKELWRHLPGEERLSRLEELRKHLGVSSASLLQPLKWQQVREMSSWGVEFGSHTVYHSILPALSESAAIEELHQSRSRLEEELEEQCTLFSYPNGDWNEACQKLVKSAGYLAALTQDRGVNSREYDLYAIKRIEVPFNETLGTFACRSTLIAL